MKARTVTFRLQVPHTSTDPASAHKYATTLAWSIKTVLVGSPTREHLRCIAWELTNQESRLPTIADASATGKGLVPVQVMIIVEPKQEMTLERQRSFELLYLVAVFTVIVGFLRMVW